MDKCRGKSEKMRKTTVDFLPLSINLRFKIVNLIYITFNQNYCNEALKLEILCNNETSYSTT